MQHSDDGNSRPVYFGGLGIRSMVIIYSPYGTNGNDSRGGGLRDRLSMGVERCNIEFLWVIPINFLDAFAL